MRRVWWHGAWITSAAVIAALIASGAIIGPGGTPTPTPTPPPSQSLNCTPAADATMTNTVSHLCGFADTTNTGPAAGVTLHLIGAGGISGPTADTGSGWQWSGSQISTTADNAVIENVQLPPGGTMQILNSGTTIRNFTIEAGGDTVHSIALRHATGVTIENGIIAGLAKDGPTRGDQGIRDIYGDAANLTIRNIEIYWHSSCLNNITDSGLIEWVYCHDMGLFGTDHVNGIQMEDGPHALLTLRNSTFLNDRNQADAVMLANDNGGTHVNRTVTHNLLAGGSFCFYGRGGPGGTSQNITFTDNHFTRLYFADCGAIGPEAYWSLGIGNSNVWSGNIWDSDGSPVNPNI